MFNTAPSFLLGDGKVAMSAGLGASAGYSVQLQSDGKIVVGGRSWNGSDEDFTLVRFNADGSLDSTFGSAGVVSTDFKSGNDSAYQVRLQADGRIVLAGQSFNGNDYDVALARYNADGSLDDSFGEGGKLTTPIGAGADCGYSLDVLADGRIVVAGQGFAGGGGIAQGLAIVRYQSDGSLDASFGGDGIVTASGQAAYGVAIQEDGKVVVTGSAADTDVDSDPFNFLSAHRFNTDGSPDDTFGTGGSVVITMGDRGSIGRGLVIQPDGKIVITGSSRNMGESSSFVLARLNGDGSLDRVVLDRFSDGEPESFGQSVALDSDGRILVAGYNTDRGVTNFAIARYNTDGTRDVTFGDGGAVITAVSSGIDHGYAVTSQEDGRILVAGEANGKFGLLRLNVDGSLDPKLDAVPTLGSSISYNERGRPVVLDGDVAVYDTELALSGSYAGASLTLRRQGGASAQDVFSASGTLDALSTGGSLVVDSVAIGTVNTNASGALSLTFDSAATSALVNSALRQIAYSNGMEAAPSDVVIEWTFSDGNTGGQGGGGAASTVGTTTVHVNSIEGTPGDDHLGYGRGRVTLEGLGGNDTLTGSRDADVLDGSAGNDVLDGRLGADWLIGGTGNDIYRIYDAADVVTEEAGQGTDTVLSYRDAHTLAANVENGRIMLEWGDLRGNALDNLLYAGAGANVIDGGGGVDTVSYAQGARAGVRVNLGLTGLQATGGSGTDRLLNVENLIGSAYADALAGGSGSNRLLGGAGNDTLDGGADADSMLGGAGNDSYHVWQAGDRVVESAGAGVDTVHSHLASYTLGNAVENGVIRRTGAASLTGNALDNVLYAGTGDNTIDGATGSDTVSYAGAASGVTLSLAVSTAQATGGSGRDTLRGVENLAGSAHADRLGGNAGENVLAGGGGNDTLDGAAGRDVMVGGAGSDSYHVRDAGDTVRENAREGTDTVYSYLARHTLADNVENGRIMAGGAATMTGNGLDNVLYAGRGDNSLQGGLGSDTVSYAYGVTGGVTVSLALGRAQSTGGSGTDTLGGIENLIGSSYADRLTGNGGENVLRAGGGADTLDGGAGRDRMVGGGGDDSYRVRDIGDLVAELAGAGSDTVFSYLARYTLGANVENGRIMAAGTAAMTGNALANRIHAGAGDNVIDGGAGIDTVSYFQGVTGGAGVQVSLALAGAQDTGGSGRDTLASVENLTGTRFADWLRGDAGANVLTGSAGNDTLRGGAGEDGFCFESPLDPSANFDRISDFAAGVDTILLDHDVFSRLWHKGALSAANFRASASGAAQDANDYVLYDTDSGRLSYDADGSGAQAAVAFAVLVGQPEVTAEDFVVV